MYHILIRLFLFSLFPPLNMHRSDMIGQVKREIKDMGGSTGRVRKNKKAGNRRVLSKKKD